MAYKKSFFFAKKGFGNHYHLLSGDDDLFVNENATRINTAVEFSPDSYTHSEAKPTFGEWFKQKKRHVTTGRYYKSVHKFMLGSEFVSRLFFYVTFIWLTIIWIRPEIVLSLFVFRFLIQLLFTKKAMLLLKEKNLLLSSLMYDLFSLFINLSIYVSSSFSSKRRQWK